MSWLDACSACAHLRRCPALEVVDGVLLQRWGDSGRCKGWSPLSITQAHSREQVLKLKGLGASSALIHQLPMTREEAMIDPNPDFYGMLYEGITKQEREEQLRYEVNEDGNPWVDKDDRKRPRGDFIVRRYALEHPHEDFPRLDNSQSIGWKMEEVISYILKHEAEIGLIAKKKSQKKESKMPTGKKVNVQRKTGAAKASPGKPRVKTGGVGKVAKPPSRSGSKVVVNKPKETREEPDANAEATLESLMAQVAATREQIDNIESKMQSLIGDLATSLIEKLNELSARTENKTQQVVDALGVLHDLHVDTGGTFQYETEEVDDEGNVLQAVDEEGEPVVDENDEPVASMIMAPLDLVMPRYDPDTGERVCGSDEGILKYLNNDSE